MISWIVFLIVGLVAGALAKAIMPGSSKEPASWLLTMLLGIGGALVGGWVAGLVGFGGSNGLLMQIVFSTIGAIIIIGLLRLFSGRRAV